MRNFINGRDAIASCLLLFMIVWIFHIYSYGLSGVFQFDDLPNLADLAEVRSLGDALLFSTEGHAGRLGRPLSLFTFALQANSWPNHPSDFLWVNFLIHTLNVVFVFAISLKLAFHLNFPKPSAEMMAFGVAMLWGLSPLLSSANLFIIQRMTTLSATFVFLGIYLHLVLTALPFRREAVREAAVLISAGVFTAIATLCKENGILLPLYILTIDWLIKLYGKKNSECMWHKLRKAALAAPLVVLFCYLALNWSSMRMLYEVRPWTAAERLLTEARVLWLYIIEFIIPRSTSVSHFGDDIVLSTGLFSPLSTLVAISIWGVVIASSIRLRRSRPEFLFGVVWYLGGHSLESSLIPLELYFAHRNYTPILGPLIACFIFFSVRKPLNTSYSALILPLVALVYSASLAQTTSLWGSPRLAREIWAIEHIYSARSQQSLSQAYAAEGDHETAYRIILEAHERMPSDLSLAIQSLQLGCIAGNDARQTIIYKKLMESYHKKHFSLGALDALGKLVNMVASNQCKSISLGEIGDLTNSILKDDRLKKTRIMLFNLHHIQAKLHIIKEDVPGAINSLVSALKNKSDLDTNLLLARLYAATGKFTKAQEILDQLEHEHAEPSILVDGRRIQIENAKNEILRLKNQHVQGDYTPPS